MKCDCPTEIIVSIDPGLDVSCNATPDGLICIETSHGPIRISLQHTSTAHGTNFVCQWEPYAEGDDGEDFRFVRSKKLVYNLNSAFTPEFDESAQAGAGEDDSTFEGEESRQSESSEDWEVVRYDPPQGSRLASQKVLAGERRPARARKAHVTASGAKKSNVALRDNMDTCAPPNDKTERNSSGQNSDEDIREKITSGWKDNIASLKNMKTETRDARTFLGLQAFKSIEQWSFCTIISAENKADTYRIPFLRLFLAKRFSKPKDLLELDPTYKNLRRRQKNTKYQACTRLLLQGIVLRWFFETEPGLLLTVAPLLRRRDFEALKLAGRSHVTKYEWMHEIHRQETRQYAELARQLYAPLEARSPIPGVLATDCYELVPEDLHSPSKRPCNDTYLGVTLHTFPQLLDSWQSSVCLLKDKGNVLDLWPDEHTFLPLFGDQIDDFDMFRESYTLIPDTVDYMTSYPQGSINILKLMLFLNSESVEEEILKQANSETDLEFLLTHHLITRTGSRIHIPSSLRTSTMERMDRSEHLEFFNAAVATLSSGFPYVWHEDIGHQFAAWSDCDMRLSHVRFLQKHQQEFGVQHSQPYAELLLSAAWFSYEQEGYVLAQNLVLAAFNSMTDKTSLACASAIDLHGLIDLDLNNPGAALKAFNMALRLRILKVGQDHPMIASSYNNVALALSDLGNFDEAHKAHKAAIKLRLKHCPSRIGNSYSNLASLLSQLQQPDEAEATLMQCPSLEGLTEEEILHTRNPRFSGDMVLLSKIRCQQGRLDDAIRLANKALTFRRQLLGDHLKTCFSLYQVASIFHAQGDLDSSIPLLDEVKAIAKNLPAGDPYLCRAAYKLSNLYADKNMHCEAESHGAEAKTIFQRLRPGGQFVEAELDRLCPYVLW